MLTRAQWLAMTRDAAEAEGSSRWDDDRIRVLGGLVMQTEWQRLLLANAAYRTALVTVTADASGRFPVSQFTPAGTGINLKHFHKVLNGRLMRGTDGAVSNEEQHATLLRSDASLQVHTQTWYVEGTDVQVVPAVAGTFTAKVSWIPALIHELGDQDAIDFPAPYEPLLAYETAAIMLMKGGSETTEAANLRAQAAIWRAPLLSHVIQITTVPREIGYADAPRMWE